MREIKFRGKRPDNGEWVYGCYAFSKIPLIEEVEHIIIQNGLKPFKVMPETIGQYTGLKDKDEKEIYEGDLCVDGTYSLHEILWSDHYQWGCKVIKGSVLTTDLTFPLWHWDNYKKNNFEQLEVVGNIYENKELLP